MCVYLNQALSCKLQRTCSHLKYINSTNKCNVVLPSIYINTMNFDASEKLNIVTISMSRVENKSWPKHRLNFTWRWSSITLMKEQKTLHTMTKMLHTQHFKYYFLNTIGNKCATTCNSNLHTQIFPHKGAIYYSSVGPGLSHDFLSQMLRCHNAHSQTHNLSSVICTCNYAAHPQSTSRTTEYLPLNSQPSLLLSVERHLPAFQYP